MLNLGCDVDCFLSKHELDFFCLKVIDQKNKLQLRWNLLGRVYRMRDFFW